MKRKMFRFAILSVVVFYSCSTMQAQERLWRSYFEVESKVGNSPVLGEGRLFLPIAQNNSQIKFADVRGHWNDEQATELNLGFGVRKILPSNWILGTYGFYDRRQSELGNNFQQLTFGAELLNPLWGFRFNGYLPEGGAGTAPNGAFLESGNAVERNEPTLAWILRLKNDCPRGSKL